jgi:protease PrsW
MWIKHSIPSYLVYVVLPGLAMVLLIHFVHREKTSTLKESCRQAFVAGNFELSECRCAQLLISNAFDIESHRNFITAHFSQPFRIGKHHYRDDASITARYDILAASNNRRMRDLGLYGRGLIESFKNNFYDARRYFARISNQELPYVNNSFGYVLAKLGNFPEAEAKYLREIQLCGNMAAPVDNLVEFYLTQSRYSAVDSILMNHTTSAFVADRYKRQLYLYRHAFLKYAENVVHGIFEENSWEGVIGAFAILFIWFLYFIIIDIFEHERLKYLIGIFLLGYMTSAFCTFIYDFYSVYLHFQLNGKIVHDILYCIFCIGLIEETVKIIPVILVFRFSKQINESLDFIIYACISALGFSFVENLLFFRTPGLHSIAGRALSAVMMHMGLSAIAIYGLMISNHKRLDRKSTLASFAFSFSIACIIHGLYDSFILGPGFIRQFGMLSLFILFSLVQIFGRMLNNGLNISVFFNRTEIPKLDVLGRYLTYSLSYVVLLQYAIMYFKFDSQNANIYLFKTALSSWLVIAMIVPALGKFSVEKNRLVPLLGHLAFHHYSSSRNHLF